MSLLSTHIVKVTTITRFEEFGPDCLRTSFSKILELKKEGDILGVEIGVWEGVNAKYMLLLCNRLRLVLVDDWSNVVIFTGGPLQGPDYGQGLRKITEVNLASHQDRTLFTYKNSAEAVLDFPDETFDYVYIDGDHEYEAAKLDMILWWPKVKTGGIMAGHDIGDEGVSRALDEFIRDKNIPLKWEKENIPPKGKIQGRSDFWIYK